MSGSGEPASGHVSKVDSATNQITTTNLQIGPRPELFQPSAMPPSFELSVPRSFLLRICCQTTPTIGFRTADGGCGGGTAVGAKANQVLQLRNLILFCASAVGRHILLAHAETSALTGRLGATWAVAHTETLAGFSVKMPGIARNRRDLMGIPGLETTGKGGVVAQSNARSASDPPGWRTGASRVACGVPQLRQSGYTVLPMVITRYVPVVTFSGFTCIRGMRRDAMVSSCGITTANLGDTSHCHSPCNDSQYNAMAHHGCHCSKVAKAVQTVPQRLMPQD